MKTQFDQKNAAEKEQIWLREVFAVRTGLFGFLFLNVQMEIEIKERVE